MFSTAYVLSSFRLNKLKTETNNMNRKPDRKVTKLKLKFLLLMGYCLIGI